jgi:N-acetylglutamate synthase-like GNAT family acetyltransferase
MAVTITLCAYADLAPLLPDARRDKLNLAPIASPTVYFRADVDGRLVGMGKLTRLSARRGRLGNLFVLAEFRRQGIGHALIQAILDHAREQAFTEVDALTYHPALFTGFGFATEKITHTSYGETHKMRMTL